MGEFKAHVLCMDLAGPAFAGTDLVLALRQNGYRVTLNKARWGNDMPEPDMLIADLRDTTELRASTLEDLNTLHKEHPDAKVYILQTFEQQTAHLLPEEMLLSAHAITTDKELDAVMFRLENDLAQQSLRMEGEARLSTLMRLNKSNGIAMQRPDMAPTKVLLAGMPCPAMLDLLQLFLRHDIEASAALTAPQAMRYLEVLDFDVLILMPGTKNATFLSLMKLLRRHDKSSDMPIITLLDETNEATNELAEKFLAGRCNAIFPVRPTKCTLGTSFIQTVETLTRDNRARAVEKKFLRRAARQVRGDLMGFSTLNFFEEHYLEHLRRNTPNCCIAAFRLVSENDSAKAQKSFSQAMVYAAMMGRDTDVITRGGTDLILLHMPMTSLEEGEKIRQRIIHVVQDLKFSKEQGKGYDNISVESSLIAVDFTAAPEEEIARAIRNLKMTFGKKSYSAPELVI